MNEATYQTRPEVLGRGTYFYTDCCGNRMYHISTNPLTYHGKLCPKCFMYSGKNVTLYLRGTPDGIRVFENEHVIKAESE